jgi:hypothetical protein
MSSGVMAERMPGPSGVGSVVLDIGGEVGAAAVYVPAALSGDELEIRAVDEPWCGAHVAVRPRVLADRTVWAALFPALDHGRYEIRVRHRAPTSATTTVAVSGGHVSVSVWQDV